jgi:hypothetical protein
MSQQTVEQRPAFIQSAPFSASMQPTYGIMPQLPSGIPGLQTVLMPQSNGMQYMAQPMGSQALYALPGGSFNPSSMASHIGYASQLSSGRKQNDKLS